MSTEYLHTIIHDERAARLIAEADYDRLVRHSRPSRHWFRRRKSRPAPVPAPPSTELGTDVSGAFEVARRADMGGPADGSGEPSTGARMPKPRDAHSPRPGLVAEAGDHTGDRTDARDRTGSEIGSVTATGPAGGSES